MVKIRRQPPDGTQKNSPTDTETSDPAILGPMDFTAGGRNSTGPIASLMDFAQKFAVGAEQFTLCLDDLTQKAKMRTLEWRAPASAAEEQMRERNKMDASPYLIPKGEAIKDGLRGKKDQFTTLPAVLPKGPGLEETAGMKEFLEAIRTQQMKGGDRGKTNEPRKDAAPCQGGAKPDRQGSLAGRGGPGGAKNGDARAENRQQVVGDPALLAGAGGRPGKKPGRGNGKTSKQQYTGPASAKAAGHLYPLDVPPDDDESKKDKQSKKEKDSGIRVVPHTFAKPAKRTVGGSQEWQVGGPLPLNPTAAPRPQLPSATKLPPGWENVKAAKGALNGAIVQRAKSDGPTGLVDDSVAKARKLDRLTPPGFPATNIDDGFEGEGEAQQNGLEGGLAAGAANPKKGSPSAAGPNPRASSGFQQELIELLQKQLKDLHDDTVEHTKTQAILQDVKDQMDAVLGVRSTIRDQAAAYS